MLGYPEAALADAEQALRDAREIGQAATLMFALSSHSVTPYFTAEITQQQRTLLMNSSLWRTKKAPVCGRRSECWYKVGYLP